MNQISFLIGSGFSAPESIPTTGEINNRLKKIHESEIVIHTSQDAAFLQPNEVDSNAYTNVVKRKFVQGFLAFYNSSALGKTESFHYEDFFDYYYSFLEDEIPESLSIFLEEFRRLNDSTDSDQRLLSDFDSTFNQLTKDLLYKKFERVSLGKPYHPNHNAFLNLLEELSENTIIHLHSLNHDLYIEYLSQSQILSFKFDDGFQEIGSPFYGELPHKHEKYIVRLPRFINEYKKQFRLYKLHGSIDHYWSNNKNQSELIKLKYGIPNSSNLLKEIQENGIPKYLNTSANFCPDFLSGTTSKIERYNKGTYYPIVFDHFKNNLKNSDYLIIIGYGFRDREINKIIEKNYNSDGNKKVFIVDIEKPNIQWLKSDSVYYINGGVVDMNIEKIISNIK